MPAEPDFKLGELVEQMNTLRDADLNDSSVLKQLKTIELDAKKLLKNQNLAVSGYTLLGMLACIRMEITDIDYYHKIAIKLRPTDPVVFEQYVVSLFNSHQLQKLVEKVNQRDRSMDLTHSSINHFLMALVANHQINTAKDERDTFFKEDPQLELLVDIEHFDTLPLFGLPHTLTDLAIDDQENEELVSSPVFQKIVRDAKCITVDPDYDWEAELDEL